MKRNRLRVIDVLVDTERIHFSLDDGREIVVPIDWFPKLGNATIKQLRKFKLTTKGDGVLWDNLDEYILVKDVLFYGREAIGDRLGMNEI